MPDAERPDTATPTPGGSPAPSPAEPPIPTLDDSPPPLPDEVPDEVPDEAPVEATDETSDVASDKTTDAAPDKAPDEMPASASPRGPRSAGFTPKPPTAWARLRRAVSQRPDAGQLAVAALVFLLGFAGAVQISGDEEDALAQARRDDLLQTLDGLTLQGERLQEQVRQLEDDRRALVSEGGSEEATLAQAQDRLRRLNILAGVSAATGPGIEVTVLDPKHNISAVTMLSAIHDLRSAGAEAIEIAGSNGDQVRVVANSYVVDSDDDLVVDGVVLEPPYTVTAIGDPASLAGAITFPLGLADDVRDEKIGGDVVVEEADQITVDAVREATAPRYASPSPDGD